MIALLTKILFVDLWRLYESQNKTENLSLSPLSARVRVLDAGVTSKSVGLPAIRTIRKQSNTSVSIYDEKASATGAIVNEERLPFEHVLELSHTTGLLPDEICFMWSQLAPAARKGPIGIDQFESLIRPAVQVK